MQVFSLFNFVGIEPISAFTEVSCTSIHGFLLRFNLQHHNSHATHLPSIDVVLLINPTWQQRRAPVEQVEMQFSITRLKLLLLQEQWIIQQREGVEDVETILVRQDEGIVHERLETGLQNVLRFFGLRLGVRREGGFRSVVVEVRGFDVLALLGAKDGGLR